MGNIVNNIKDLKGSQITICRIGEHYSAAVFEELEEPISEWLSAHIKGSFRAKLRSDPESHWLLLEVRHRYKADKAAILAMFDMGERAPDVFKMPKKINKAPPRMGKKYKPPHLRAEKTWSGRGRKPKNFFPAEF